MKEYDVTTSRRSTHAVLAALVVSTGVWSACGSIGPPSAVSPSTDGGDAIVDAGSDGAAQDLGSTLAASALTTCARFNARTCCWGGALVNPTVVPLAAAPTDIAVLGGSACAVVAGEVWCWPFAAKTAPSRLNLGGTARVARITAGGGHACALRQDDTVACWGVDTFGQVGNGRFAQTVASPTDVPNLTDVGEIAAGEYRTCARRRSGSVACWGRGFGTAPCAGSSNVCSAAPVEISLPKPAIHLSAGGLETCAQTADGTVYCWLVPAGDATTPPTVAAPLAGAGARHPGYGLRCARSHNHQPLCRGAANHPDYPELLFPEW